MQESKDKQFRILSMKFNERTSTTILTKMKLIVWWKFDQAIHIKHNGFLLGNFQVMAKR